MNLQLVSSLFSCPCAHGEGMEDHFMGLIYSLSEQSNKAVKGKEKMRLKVQFPEVLDKMVEPPTGFS